MLYLIPAPLHRLALRTGHAVRRTWWRLARPEVRGVCMIATDRAGRLLLLRQSYGTDRWVLPGGGLGRREDPGRAAMRELHEEAGCLVDEAAFVFISDEQVHGTANRIHVFAGTLLSEPRIDGREIVEAGLFALDALPPDISPRVLRRLASAGVLPG